MTVAWAPKPAVEPALSPPAAVLARGAVAMPVRGQAQLLTVPLTLLLPQMPSLVHLLWLTMAAVCRALVGSALHAHWAGMHLVI